MIQNFISISLLKYTKYPPNLHSLLKVCLAGYLLRLSQQNPSSLQCFLAATKSIPHYLQSLLSQHTSSSRLLVFLSKHVLCAHFTIKSSFMNICFSLCMLLCCVHLIQRSSYRFIGYFIVSFCILRLGCLVWCSLMSTLSSLPRFKFFPLMSLVSWPHQQSPLLSLS